jgi:hypothetical protein
VRTGLQPITRFRPFVFDVSGAAASGRGFAARVDFRLLLRTSLEPEQPLLARLEIMPQPYRAHARWG